MFGCYSIASLLCFLWHYRTAYFQLLLFHSLGSVEIVVIARNSLKMSSTAPSTSRFRPSSTLKKQHIANQAVTWSNWYEHVAWINVIFVAGIPLFGIISAFSTPLLQKTAIWAFVYYFMTGLGITAGRFLAIPFSIPNRLRVYQGGS